MKAFLIAAISLSIYQTSNAQAPVGKIDPTTKLDTLEVACGMCQFDMTGDDCALAARVNTRTYYVEGTHIDKHGDAHAKDGFCNMIRKAEVQGAFSGEKYKVTYFKLLPLDKVAPKKP
ncbi:DUF6370 family protein [Terrimonas sp. NA20]|uniref:DUF6370 family protein n=1 Tax=Terrimonas ginsenosidimutans TaxID=2908004 RepID=A0ABS9KK55_9BACT|nr:DUF6370 family protein [Terrimonas ginsenosidimutans]MCG2612645.1 DUF6370 family protein [Terrimonas ginsenosidimutans]